MRILAERAYRVMVIIMALMCLYALFTFRIDKVYSESFPASHSVDTVQHTTMEDERSVTGVSDRYLISIKDVKLDYNSLFIYTVHQDIYVYAGEELIYSMTCDPSGYISSAGRVWNQILLTEDMSNSVLRIEIVPLLKSVQELVPTIYVGEEYEIRYRIINRDFLSLIFSTLVFITGTVIMIIEMVRYERGSFKEDMFFAGILVALVALLKISQSPVVAMATAKIPALSQLPYFIMMLLGIPFLFSIKAFLRGDGVLWYVAFYINFFCGLFSIGLLLTKIMDLSKTQMLSIGGLVIAAIISAFEIYKYRRKEGASEEYKLALAELLAAVFWFVCDMGAYIISGMQRTSSIGVFSMVVFLVLVIKYNMDKAGILMEVGSNARNYEKIAFKDALTNFFNRAAYVEYVEGEYFRNALNGVLVFDLNDLKKCNDTLGHAKGDQYIKDSAAIIAECFGDLGQCYRLGGDEFSVIFPAQALPELEDRRQIMLMKVADYNAQSPDIHMGIACGYAAYDGESDENFADTAKRADQMMYQEKYRMKHSS